MILDFRYLIQFYIAFIVLGIAVLPLSVKLFGNIRDKGYMLAKALGLYICGYFMWLLSSLHILKFNAMSSVICVFIICAVNYGYAYMRYKKGDKYFLDSVIKSRNEIIISEIVFLVLFIAINWLFAHRVQSFATERLMDYGFMVSIAKTDYMAPKDMWAAGNNINYYYFGQYIFVFMQKISGISVGHAYTFGLFGIMTWMLIAIYRIVESVTNSRLAGVISSLVATVGGNLHYVVYKYIVPIIWEMMGSQGEEPHYWFADSTRYIGYNPVVEGDKTIHEFPMYSFIIGDLHAHVTNIMAVLLIVALLWSWLHTDRREEKGAFKLLVMSPQIYAIGFLLAVSSMANYWDFPIYYVVSGSIILFGMIMDCGLGRRAVSFVAYAGVVIIAMSYILSLPFNLQFEKMVEGIGVATMHTRFYQLLILWGLPIGLVVAFIAMLIREKIFYKKHLYVMLLGLCATGLVIVPEFIFVKDIYINGFPRANTMFKLTFEAFILFGICSGCIVSEMYKQSKKNEDALKKYIYLRRTAIAVILLALAIGYCPMALRMWFRDGDNSKYISMDAAYTIKEEMSAQMDAIEELEAIAAQDGNRQPVVLVADGDSYSRNCTISALTGFPTVLGWHTHEWLWHNSREFYDDRRQDVEDIYIGTDPVNTYELLKKYDVDYIYIGPDEYEKYEDIQSDLLETLGETVYSRACETGQLIEIIRVEKDELQQ